MRRLAVYANLSGEPLEVDLGCDADATVVLTNYDDSTRAIFAPWEARVMRAGRRPRSR